MRISPSIDVIPVRTHFDLLLGKGVPQKELERSLGFSREELDNNDLRIPYQNNIRMLRKGVELTEPGMAVTLGTMASPEGTGILGQIMKNCRNMSEATAQFVRFQNLNHGVSSFKTRGEGGSSMLVHSFRYSIPEYDQRLLTELNFSSILTNIRKLLGAEFVPQEMRFSHAKPSYVAAYERHFRSPLKFDQDENAFVIDPKQFEIPISGSQPYMKNVLLEYAGELLGKLEAARRFQDEVRRVIAELLPEGFVDIERVSEKLNMSRWTLTRKLKNEGTTFKELLKTLRKEIALNCLENERLSTAEIAFLLGYSEASAFQRAFKSWTGENPYSYRLSRL